MLSTQRSFLLRAIELAREHSLHGVGGPFGAVIVEGDQIVSEGWNEVTSAHDPTAHAEVMAIRHAAKVKKSHSLKGCVMYASCEPCPMCFGAIHWARLDGLYFAASREDAAAIGFDDALLHREVRLDPFARTLPTEQAEQAAAVAAMRAWWWTPGRVTY
jgi:guanine deaminase